MKIAIRFPFRSSSLFYAGPVLAAAIGISLAVSVWSRFAGVPVVEWGVAVTALEPAAGLILGAASFGAMYLRRYRTGAGFGAALAVLAAQRLAGAAVSPLLRFDGVTPGRLGLSGLVSSGRMSPLAALALLSVSIALIAAGARRRTHNVRSTIGTAAAIAAIAAAVSLATGLVSVVTPQFAVRLRGMDLSTAVGILALCAGLLGISGPFAERTGDGAAPEAASAAPQVGLALTVLLSLTFIAFQWMLNDLGARVFSRFERTSMDIVDDIGDRMPGYAVALRATAQMVERAEVLSRSGWIEYVAALRLSQTYAGSGGLGYAVHVPARALPQYLRRAEALWPEGYDIFPPGQRPEYLPILLFEPKNPKTPRVAGFDHLSETARRTAIFRARDSGEPEVSSHSFLVADQNRPTRSFAFFIYMPVYRERMPLGSVEERRAAFQGAVFSSLRMDRLIPGILGDRYPGVRVRVLDGDPAEGAFLVFDSGGTPDGSRVSSIPRDALSTGAIILGHRWTVLTTPAPSYAPGEQRTGPWLLLGSGVIISALFAAALWQLFAIEARARSLNEAQALNAEISSRLQAEQALQAEREAARLRVEALNRDLARHARELELSNRDLEAFSYTVSHDLQQPVAGIAGYSSMILEDYGKHLPPEVKDALNRIMSAGFRMSELIQGLLALARAAQTALTREPVDLTALAGEILQDLQATQPERKVETVVAKGLVASGDRKLLRVLMNNLLGNAWKYTSHIQRAVIELDRVETERGLAYRVRDNGAGFDMAQAQRLFGVFQRLHEDSEFSGSGIGLATAHRIVTRHGGEIWAEAQPGRGATFYFTLPDPA